MGHQSRVLTFYSYKGGVGRTMALANVACDLALRGRRVLAIDWDLEAPGLERYLSNASAAPLPVESMPGVIDLIAHAGDDYVARWLEAAIQVELKDLPGSVDLISAGERTDDYSQRLHAIDWEELFTSGGLGARLEELRIGLLSEYDYVLLDSRTGITDIGGICTVHLADILLVLFTANDQSVRGSRQVIDRVRTLRQHLPYDRDALATVPIASRDESRTEYTLALEWRDRFAREFDDVYRDWLPAGVSAADALEVFRVPHVPYWSFGERIPVLLEGTSDPTSLGHAYSRIAGLLDSGLDWGSKAERGQDFSSSAIDDGARRSSSRLASAKSFPAIGLALLAVVALSFALLRDFGTDLLTPESGLSPTSTIGAATSTVEGSGASGESQTSTRPTESPTTTGTELDGTNGTASTGPASPTSLEDPALLELAQVATLAATGSATEGFDACGVLTNFDVANLSDGDLSTAWRTVGDGSGVVVQAQFGSEHEVLRVGLVPGYAKVDACDGSDRFLQNRRVQTVRWTVGDVSAIQELDTSSPTMQTMELPEVAEGDLLVLEILQTTQDGGRDFVAISDVTIRGRALEPD